MKNYEDHPNYNLLVSNLIWDLVPHSEAPEMMVKLGLTPPGDGGQKMECVTSHLRIALVKPLENDIDLLAEKIGEIVIKVMLGDAAEQIGADLLKGLVKQYELVISAAVKVALANLLATGILVHKQRT